MLGNSPSPCRGASRGVNAPLRKCSHNATTSGRKAGSGGKDAGTASGEVVSEYDYFQQSIRGFPRWREFAKLMNSSGFRVDSVTHFVFGAVQLYEGTKI